ncbi:MAG: endolytic transglycosylase MltG [Candidatus Pacebacteria bacterium]|nr:endolytic transglycosylase MltG [Candidatus Paceibacterota bacterium]MDD5357181.1 endolytic transglycosylase MltG [Candidatus Paceibacterota bacterium]
MRFPKYLLKRKALLIIAGCVLLVAFYFLSLPPSGFPSNKIVMIESGSSLKEVGSFLKEKGIIRSSFLFDNFVILLNHEKAVISGEYVFTKPLSVFSIAKRVSAGDFGFPLKRVTIPEGLNTLQIANLMPAEYFHFSKNEFLKLTTKDEGYLFPDTYFFPINITTENIIKTLSENFEKKTGVLKADVLISGRTFKDAITMASILEEEALTSEDRKMVAGVLWKRLKLGMRLQVDAPLSYVTDKTTFELTLKDLKFDSPYNTYLHTGLPPGPISNPGLDAIDAAIHPTTSKYLFYLSGRDGVMHYAATYAEHLANKKKYLD